ncbi:MAG: VOC family protein [Rhizobiaceae bacterium]|nr:VOC family protein [Rhizobiaceae bacterium]MCV0406446.1 VOC family protein [Rhizobiaceae bacterium]
MVGQALRSGILRCDRSLAGWKGPAGSSDAGNAAALSPVDDPRQLARLIVNTRAPRPLDHCVLSTADLGTARGRLSALGFTVAPAGVHPFGTANACIYFADGTFLEPLSVDRRELTREAIAKHNVFVAHDARYRSRNGDEGFSALVFGTEDARADHAAFVAAGYSAGPILDFSRPARDAFGREDVAAFRLAFARDASAVDTLFFTCQRVLSPKIDRAALEVHPNGAFGMASVILTAGDPTAFGSIVSLVSGRSSDMDGPGSSLQLMSTREFARDFGGDPPDEDQLRLRAIVFRVPDLGRLLDCLNDAGIPSRRSGGRPVVDPAPGQGAIFIFDPR